MPPTRAQLREPSDGAKVSGIDSSDLTIGSIDNEYLREKAIRLERTTSVSKETRKDIDTILQKSTSERGQEWQLNALKIDIYEGLQEAPEAAKIKLQEIAKSITEKDPKLKMPKIQGIKLGERGVAHRYVKQEGGLGWIKLNYNIGFKFGKGKEEGKAKRVGFWGEHPIRGGSYEF
jgi:hypothetical protein